MITNIQHYMFLWRIYDKDKHKDKKEHFNFDDAPDFIKNKDCIEQIKDTLNREVEVAQVKKDPKVGGDVPY